VAPVGLPSLPEDDTEVFGPTEGITEDEEAMLLPPATLLEVDARAAAAAAALAVAKLLAVDAVTEATMSLAAWLPVIPRGGWFMKGIPIC